MQVFFYEIHSFSEYLEPILTEYFQQQGVSVSCKHVTHNELTAHLQMFYTSEACLLFYRLSDVSHPDFFDSCFSDYGMKVRKTALCENYSEGIQAVENGSDYALSLPLNHKKVLKCCQFFQKKSYPTLKNTRPVSGPLNMFEEYQELMNTLHLGISRHILDDEMTLIEANHYFYQLLGTTAEEVNQSYNNSGLKYFHSNPERFFTLKANIINAYKNKTNHYEEICPFPQASGGYLWLQLKVTFSDTMTNGYPQFFMVYNNISEYIDEQKRNQELIARLSLTDALTGGYSIARFESEMAQIVNQAEENTYSLISLDIQHFKLINEMYGITCGDRSLKYIHTEFSTALEKDELVARISSDNFVLLLRKINADEIYNWMLAAIEHLNRFNAAQVDKYYFAFYAGACLIDDPELPLATLLDRANIARKKSLQDTSSPFLSFSIYKQKDRQILISEKHLGNRMESALKNHEFLVYFQPKIDPQTNQILGAEALVRWDDPERGLLAPGVFIPLFEKNGFITKLDLYVFEEVCRHIRKWLDLGLTPVVVSTNLSRAHITSRHFLSKYEAVRKKYNIPVEYLEFEMTESMIMEQPECFKSVIQEMHDLGYRCSMDDFGSGYSSLNILKDMDFDVIKLDRAFFDTKNELSHKQQEIISTVITLAGKLDMKSVAEGVETPQQMEFLKTTGCDLVQGFVFSKPLPVHKYEQMKYGDS